VSESGPTYVAVYQCQSSAILGIPLEEFPGIRSLQAVTGIRTEDIPDVVSEGLIVCFQDRDAFAASQQPLLQFLTRTDPAAGLVWSGLEFQSRSAPVARVPWYQSLTGKWAIFATVIGGLGVLDSARNHWLDFFERAQMIDVSPRESIHTLVTDPWKAEFQIKNAARGIACAMSIEHIEIQLKDRRVRINTPQLRFPAVRSGDREAVVLESELLSPAERERIVGRPGRYRLEACGRAWGGYLTVNQRFRFLRELRVWPLTGLGTPQVVSLPGTSQTAQVRIPIHVGKAYPKGQKCKITLFGCRIKALRLGHTPVAVQPSTFNPSGAVATVTWETTAVGPYDEYPVTLALEADVPRDQKGWEAILAESQLQIAATDRVE